MPLKLSTRLPRTLIAVGVAFGLLLLLVLLLNLTDSALSVWDRMQQVPTWFFILYGLGFLLIGGGGFFLVWRLLVPKKAKKGPPEPVKPPSEEELEQRLQEQTELGLDVAEVQRELAELKERRKTGKVYVALMGRISTGKSALIRALLPGAEVESDPRGGTTRIATHYTWSSPANDQLILTDVPGLDEVGGELDDMAREEGARAHVVVFVTDSDITREQDRELKGLLALGKPTIVALNKMDLYTKKDLAAIKDRLTERVVAAKDVQVVAVSAGGTQDAIRQLPDGSEQEIVREVPPKVEALQFALQRYIDRDIEALNSLRDGAVFVLAQRKLDDAEAVHRHEKAEKLVSSYTKKAVVGAMAAVTPGSDLIIQGYLGLSLVKDLCEVYQVPARKMDIQQFLTFVSRHVGKTLTLLLAVAGNGLKAFPGLGTVAGGLVHAVAYGLIFDSLGRAVIETLETRGELNAAPAAIMFEEKLGEDLESRARYFAKLALAGRRGKDKGQADDPA